MTMTDRDAAIDTGAQGRGRSDHPREDLETYLRRQGYERLALERSATGQLLTGATVNGSGVTLIVDTGASKTVLDETSARRLGLRAATEGGVDEATGAGGSMACTSVAVEAFDLPDVSLGPRSVAVVDLGHATTRLQEMGIGGIDGVVGADILRHCRAVLEYEPPTLYLRLPGPD
jgi:clan AA aspartic protease (TIGR02281 family)